MAPHGRFSNARWSGIARQRVVVRPVVVMVRLSTADDAFAQDLELPSIAPDFISTISGYDLKRRQGQFPEVLSQPIARWLGANGCAFATLEALTADLDGTMRPMFAPPTIWQSLDRRLRNAGIVRQSVNRSLDDRTVDPEELRRLMKTVSHYLDACRVDPPIA